MRALTKSWPFDPLDPVQPPVNQGFVAAQPLLDPCRPRAGRGPVKRILIVEDNEVNRDVLSRRLTRHGFEVATAHDGVQGLASARSGAPDLILMDLGLPEIDGWECARRLKADARTRHIPIIALTAHAMLGEREKALAAGCDDFDTKPIDFAALLQKIQQLLTQAA